MQFQDATLEVNAGLGGLHSVTLTCRNFTRVFTKDQLTDLMSLLYPAINAIAKSYDTPAAP